jgi:hypothetical protein
MFSIRASDERASPLSQVGVAAGWREKNPLQEQETRRKIPFPGGGGASSVRRPATKVPTWLTLD